MKVFRLTDILDDWLSDAIDSNFLARLSGRFTSQLLPAASLSNALFAFHRPHNMSKAQIVLTTLVIYKLLLVSIGLWASKRNQNNDDFYLGGRGLGPFVAALSYSASAASAWVLLGLSGIAYTYGISTIWAALGSITGMFVTWYWIAPRINEFSRQHDHITLTEIVAHKTEGAARRRIMIASTLIIVFSFVFYVAAQFQGAGSTFASSFDMRMDISIMLGASIILIYTLLGGFWAVSLTDAVQGLLMAVTSVVLPLTAYMAVGGYQGLVQGLAASETAGVLSLNGANLGWAAIGIVIGGLSIGLGTYGQPHLMARLMALRDKPALLMARRLTILWYFIVFIGMWFVGLVGHVLYSDIGNSEQVFFVMLDGLVPTVLAAIMLAAVLSAIMSTADSQLLSAAAAISNDLFSLSGEPSKNLLISRLVIVILVVVSVIVAIYLPDKIFSRVLFAWQALGAAFGPLLFARLAHRSMAPGAVLSAILCGFFMTIVLSLLPNGPADVWERLVPFCCSAMIVWGLSRPAVGRTDR